jgi:hypothetical protein
MFAASKLSFKVLLLQIWLTDNYSGLETDYELANCRYSFILLVTPQRLLLLQSLMIFVWIWSSTNVEFLEFPNVYNIVCYNLFVLKDQHHFGFLFLLYHLFLPNFFFGIKMMCYAGLGIQDSCFWKLFNVTSKFFLSAMYYFTFFK